MRQACIVDAVRLPRAKIGKSGSVYSEQRPVDMLKPLFDALTTRQSFDTALVDDVMLGCNTQIDGQGANIAKTAALYAGWSDSVSGATINRFCCSGLDAINIAASKIMSGMNDIMVAGGVEQISQVSMFKDNGDWFSYPKVMQATRFMHMGLSADLIACLQGFDRQQLDDYALRSHQRAALAAEHHYFSNSLIPLEKEGITIDNGIRPSADITVFNALPTAFDDALAKARPMLEAGGIKVLECRHSAGSSPALVDGASLVLMASVQACSEHQLPVRARVIQASDASADPVIMLTGHIKATEKLLASAGLTADDIDLWEINESFAASVLNYQRHFAIADNQLNVNGGAIAMGHPLGATGGILLSTVLDELERQQLKRAVIAIPGGAGVGVATLIERE
ncbi:acetyl-CoA C-acyltransferase [Thalassotalea euphylliae]|uniref:Acetyl-CoA C-acyltransferase n=1 Tax=Thalassotalea euphylliae TaxID=1655234 RepID=A0A3E0TQN9_9GAMM|nr:acetyl-CoA C-acyltransferase [Thalassotalea euphylliae]REL26352.1 acetyl-CoA C-acyltransferase [Thalassotalea euphylliae]